MRYTQPQSGPVSLDPNNPLSKGWGIVAVPGQAEIIGGKLPILSGGFSLGADRAGVAAVGPLTQIPGYIGYDATNPMVVSGDFTILLVASATQPWVSGAIYTHNIDHTGALGNTALSIGSDKVSVMLDNNGGTAFSGDFTQPTVFIATRTGNSAKLYISGVLVGTWVTGTRTGTITGLTFGRNRTGSNNGNQTSGFLIEAMPRALSAYEVQALSNNPWQIFKSPRRIFSVTSGGVPATVTPSGVQVSSAVGSPSATGAAVAIPSGVQSISAVGTPIVTAGATAVAFPSGVYAASAIGVPSAQGVAIAQPSGVQVVASVGTPTAIGDTYIPAIVYPTGVQAVSVVGTPTAIGGSSIPATAYPIGVTSVSSIGVLVVTGSAIATPDGVQAVSYVGIPIAIGGASIPAIVYPTGVQATSAVGTPTATSTSIAAPIGVQATSSIGILAATGGAFAYPVGLEALSQVGTPIIINAATAYAIGVQASSYVGAPTARVGEIEFGEPLIASMIARNWIATNTPRNWTVKKD